MGFKAPRGMGMFTNPKKALYNKLYNQTTASIDRLPKGVGKKRGKSSESGSGHTALDYVEQKIEDRSYARHFKTNGKHVCSKCGSDS